MSEIKIFGIPVITDPDISADAQARIFLGAYASAPPMHITEFTAAHSDAVDQIKPGSIIRTELDGEVTMLEVATVTENGPSVTVMLRRPLMNLPPIIGSDWTVEDGCLKRKVHCR